MSANSGRLFTTSECEDVPERTPLGLTRSGQPVWPIYGAQPDDDDDADDDADDDDDEDDDPKDKRSKGKGSTDDSDDELAEALASAERYRRRMRAADRRAAEAERERDALKNKSTEGDEDQSAVVAEKDKEIQSLSEANRGLRLENAFLLNNSYSWHDPEDVMALALKDEEIEIDEDGKVHGMDGVLKRIAKKKPWLIKAEAGKDSSDDDDDDDDEDDTEDAPEARRRSTRTGSTSVGRRKRKGDVDREALLRTYPAIARR